MTEHTLICSESGVRLDKFIADADIGVSDEERVCADPFDEETQDAVEKEVD